MPLYKIELLLLQFTFCAYRVDNVELLKHVDALTPLNKIKITNCSYVMNTNTYSSLMDISGIHSLDLGMLSMFIPQKSDEFQVRNSFVQRWEKEKTGF